MNGLIEKNKELAVECKRIRTATVFELRNIAGATALKQLQFNQLVIKKIQELENVKKS